MKIDARVKPELAVSHDETRYQLADPYLDAAEQKLIATNGRMLIAVPVEVAEGETSRYVSVRLLRVARRWARSETPDPTRIEIVGDAVPKGPSYPTNQERRFPEWKAVLPQKPCDPGTVTFGLDAVYLKNLALALGGEDQAGGCQVALTVSLANMPVRVDGEGVVAAKVAEPAEPTP